MCPHWLTAFTASPAVSNAGASNVQREVKLWGLDKLLVSELDASRALGESLVSPGERTLLAVCVWPAVADRGSGAPGGTEQAPP
jgi:hypothetical protein